VAAGTEDDPWQLVTPPGSSRYTMHVDGDELVCVVGITVLRYRSRAVDDLAEWLQQQGDRMRAIPR